MNFTSKFSLGQTVYYPHQGGVFRDTIKRIEYELVNGAPTVSYTLFNLSCHPEDKLVATLQECDKWLVGQIEAVDQPNAHVPDSDGWVTWDFSSTDGPIGWVVNGVTINNDTTLKCMYGLPSSTDISDVGDWRWLDLGARYNIHSFRLCE